MTAERKDHSTQTENDRASASDDTSSGAQSDMHELLGELRAEVTRLKAEKAKAEALNWIQRHPLLAVSISMGIGTAAGYGAASAFRTRPPRTLSEHARQRLGRLSEDAQNLAVRLGQRLGERAAKSGEEVRRRAERAGRRLAEEAREAGRRAGKEAQDVARSASERASESVREATGEAARRVQERGAKAGDEVRELGKKLGEKASETVKGYTGRSNGKSSADGSRPFLRSLLALGGLAAGGYLAAKVRNFL